jgi:hypothetical protein
VPLDVRKIVLFIVREAREVMTSVVFWRGFTGIIEERLDRSRLFTRHLDHETAVAHGVLTKHGKSGQWIEVTDSKGRDDVEERDADPYQSPGPWWAQDALRRLSQRRLLPVVYHDVNLRDPSVHCKVRARGSRLTHAHKISSRRLTVLVTSALVIAVYVVGAQRIGNVYPWSAFDMFAGHWDRATRLLVLDERLEPVPEGLMGVGYCGAITASTPLPTCRGDEGHPETEVKLLREIAGRNTRHATAPTVFLARRTYRLEAGEIIHSDCVLRRCSMTVETAE